MIFTDLDRELISSKGEPQKWVEATGEKGKQGEPLTRELPFTFRRMLFEMLLAKAPEIEETEKQRFEYFELARTINPDSLTPSESIKLESEDVSHLKKKGHKMFPNSWDYGQLYEFLEGSGGIGLLQEEPEEMEEPPADSDAECAAEH